MPEISTAIPTSFVRGDTVAWRVELADYPADDGWVLSYVLVKDGEHETVTASADGSAHLVEIAAATSALYAAGLYAWQAYVTKAAVRYTLGSGQLEVCINFADQTSGYDARTTNRKILEALEATLERRASKIQSSHSIDTPDGGRQISMLSHAELIAAIDRYRSLVRQEERVANSETGSRGRIHARFR